MARTSTIVFFFDEDRLDCGESQVSFLRALKKIDTQRVTRSLVLRGSLLIRSLCYKPARVSASPAGINKGSRATSGSTSIQLAGDKKLLATLAGDLSEALASQWNTLDQTELWSLIANHSLDCIFLPTLPVDYRSVLDQALRAACPAYLGAAEPDLANPLQRELLADSLFKDAFIADGAVHMTLEYDGNFEGSFYGADEFSKCGIITLPPEEFETRCPPLDVPTALSPRGLVSLIRLQNRRALNVHERLARALSGDVVRAFDADFDWDVRQLPNAPEEVEVQSRKLTGYLLNRDHAKGRSKAEFFERELGITSSDSDFLQSQLIDALRAAPLTNVRLDEYGIRFGALLPVKGRNGRTATIETAWIVRSGERASLVTAFPGAKDEDLELQAQSPNLVPGNLQGNARWQAIFDLAMDAGRQAAEQCVPTPMKIAGGELIMDGECGGAYVVVPDARKGFARWLKTTENGSPHHHSGMRFYAERNDQSADRATAYAEGFAKVLRRNGVEATVVKYLT